MRGSFQRSVIVLTSLLALVATGCYIDFGSSGGGSKTVTLEKLAWTYSNISGEYWSGTAPTEEVFLSFALRIEETDLIEPDFERVKFSARGESWTADSSAFDYDASAGVLRVSLLSSEDSPYALPLTGWSVEVVLANGRSDTGTFDLNPPGKSDADTSLTHVYNDSYPTTPPSSYVEVVNQPVVLGPARNDTLIRVDFRVNDSNVYNGWIEFYDASDNYIGRSDYFVNWSSGAVNTEVFPDNELYTNGVDNNAAYIETADVVLDPSAAFADIAKVVIVVTDGAQYMSSSAYNYQGVSSREDLGNL